MQDLLYIYYNSKENKKLIIFDRSSVSGTFLSDLCTSKKPQ
jgi:hypothetical protein